MHHRNRHPGRFGVLILVALLAACEGAAGPTGPTGATGPAGPQGPAGPGTRYTSTAIVGSSGSASIQLPAEAGTSIDPPVVSCYISDTGNTWLVVATDVGSGLSCGLVWSNNRLNLRVIGAPSGWLFRGVAVW